MKHNFQEHINRQLDAYGYVAEVETHKLVHINETLLQRLSLTLEECVGKKCHQIIFDHKEPCVHCNMGQLQENQGKQWFRNSDRTHKYYSMKDSLFQENGTMYFLQTAYEITEEMQEVLHLKESAAADTAIIACANTLLNGVESIKELLQIVTEFFQGDCAYIFERDATSRTTNITHSYCTPEAKATYENELKKSFGYEQDSVWTQEISEKNYIFFHTNQPELSFFPYKDSFFSVADNHNFLMGGLKDNENAIIGVIGVNNIKVNKNHIPLFATIIAFVSNRLNTQNTLNHLEKQNLFNNAMLQCVSTLVNSEHLESAIQTLLDVICSYFEGDEAVIYARKGKSLVMEYVEIDGSLSKEADAPEASSELFEEWYQNFKEQDVAYVGNVDQMLGENYGTVPEFLELKKRKTSSFLMTPLFKHEQITGYLWIDNPKKNYGDTALLTAISSFLVNHFNKDELLRKLKTLSYTDSLTGLYNRNFYNNYLEHLDKNKAKNFGIFFADVNGLKKANDNFGHELGDILLKWSGVFFERFMKTVQGFVCRIGGDEFVCFVEDITREQFNRLEYEIQEKLVTYGDVHISIGSVWSEEVLDSEKLVNKADALMYAEKQRYYKRKREDNRTIKDELADYATAILNLKTELQS